MRRKRNKPKERVGLEEWGVRSGGDVAKEKKSVEKDERR